MLNQDYERQLLTKPAQQSEPQQQHNTHMLAGSEAPGAGGALMAIPTALFGPAHCAAATDKGIPLANVALASVFARPPTLLRITRGTLITVDQDSLS